MTAEARPPEDGAVVVEAGPSGLDLLLPLVRHWKLLSFGPLLFGLAVLGVTFLFKPVYTAKTTFLLPQQQQNAGAAALASLGALAGVAGAANVRTPADQYASLLQSVQVRDRLIDQFKLMQLYDVELRVDARKRLEKNVRAIIGKKDGMLSVEVDDTSPQRAAEMANQHVAELRRLTSELALTEAQQRRMFFEREMKQTRERLTAAQVLLQASGFNAGALRAEPRAAAESYAKLRAEATAAEVRLQTLRRGLTDNAPEVLQQITALSALRQQLAKQEVSAPNSGDPDYIGKYREFKYQETLFETFSRQYEMARLDESKEGALIQVIDTAMPPERKSRPRRALWAIFATLGALLIGVVYVLARHLWRQSTQDPARLESMQRLRSAWRGGT